MSLEGFNEIPVCRGYSIISGFSAQYSLFAVGLQEVGYASRVQVGLGWRSYLEAFAQTISKLRPWRSGLNSLGLKPELTEFCRFSEDLPSPKRLSRVRELTYWPQILHE